MAITTLLLDIEGTVCPITFVKEGLFPHFLEKLPAVLSSVSFPLDGSTIMSKTLQGFPEDVKHSKDTLLAHITRLVQQDVKEKNLKSLQGLVWSEGYASGEIKAPLYPDAIDSIKKWSENRKVYIYSSGSVHAQKLLFGHVDVNGESVDLNPLLSGYFDITTSGYKSEQSSYESIVKDVGVPADEILFLSDSIKEVEAALAAGLQSNVAVRPGNAPLTDEQKLRSTLVSDFTTIEL